MAATIFDVAKRAGVGIGTVSRAINNSPQIRPETKARVMEAIRELKYQPQPMAQGLARKKSNTIGCVVPFFTGYFFVELLRGIQRQISDSSYDLILYSVDDVSRKKDYLKRVLQERRVDGVLVASMTVDDKYARRFVREKVPVILVDSHHEELDSIAVENELGALEATRHLIDLGHHDIGMITGHLGSSPARIRLDGYRKALAEAGIAHREELVVAADSLSMATSHINDGFNKFAGYESMNRLLDLNSQCPTAVFASSDIQAVGAIVAMRERGLRIPEDVAVVGFDNIELAEYMGLTTMKQPMYDMGRLAAERLLTRIAEKPKDKLQRRLQTTLVVRESCGAKRSDAAFGSGVPAVSNV